MRWNNVIRRSSTFSTVLIATVALLACILLTPARTSFVGAKKLPPGRARPGGSFRLALTLDGLCDGL